MLRGYLLLLLLPLLLHGNILQEAIDNAPEGSILKLPAGVYHGSVVINKPLSIIGKEDGVIIDGDGNDTVIKIESSFVTLKNLKIVGSGSRSYTLDSAIKIKNVKQCEVSHCIIDDCLFGIDMQMTSNSIIQNNTISSKNLTLGLRGDGLRLWYSHNNIIRKNRLIRSRDMVVWYSHRNLIEGNYGE
ncbi:MAG: right-handed parallel beta-helix repeat-containing protein, partial [Sulfurovaceae bacterium]|nr:right-handed parallel beta-helix repeat-containing protein [Sulfurovaceae bacterium]